jgi:hypothetical protein
MTRASRRKYHITYKTVCLETGRYYIGMHSTDTLNDGYLGSGVRLRRSIQKYGKDRHTRQILAVFATREQAAQNEVVLLSEEVRKDPLCMNCGPGGLGATDRTQDTEATKEKRREASLQIHANRTDDERRRIAIAISRANKIALNKPVTKDKQSQAAKARWENEEYRNFHSIRAKRKHTEEAKAKMAAAKLGKKLHRTAEHNARIAAAHKARWDKLKAQK